MMRSQVIIWYMCLKFFIHYVVTFIYISLSELPECQVPLAMGMNIINQILSIALSPACNCYTAKVSVEIILNLTQSPEAHAYIARSEVVENLLEICEQRHKIIDQQLAQGQQINKEDPMVVNVLKYVTIPSPFSFHSPVLSFSFTHTQYK